MRALATVLAGMFLVVLFVGCGDSEGTGDGNNNGNHNNNANNNESCGNGVANPGEECDGADLDGNDCTTIGQDFDSGTLGCSADCRFDVSQCVSVHCGDGNQDAGEECDDGAQNSNVTPDACRLDCTLPACGDGVTDPSYDEECDDGAQNSDVTPDACRQDCSLPTCGDNVTDPSYSEECDDGAQNSNVTPDACRTNCLLPFCGDGIVDPSNSETCDDGAQNSDVTPDACRTDCVPAHCGDDVKDSNEACDGSDLAGADCITLGYAGGVLSCKANCMYDTSQCISSGGCTSNNDCQPAVEFCAKAVGDCDGEGQCAVRPEACPMVYDPVCGCDGQTYGNGCFAASAGVNVWYAGQCI